MPCLNGFSVCFRPPHPTPPHPGPVQSSTVRLVMHRHTNLSWAPSSSDVPFLFPVAFVGGDTCGIGWQSEQVGCSTSTSRRRAPLGEVMSVMFTFKPVKTAESRGQHRPTQPKRCWMLRRVLFEASRILEDNHGSFPKFSSTCGYFILPLSREIKGDTTDIWTTVIIGATARIGAIGHIGVVAPLCDKN